MENLIGSSGFQITAATTNLFEYRVVASLSTFFGWGGGQCFSLRFRTAGFPPMTCVVVAPRALTSITQKARLGEEVVVCN